MSKLTREQFGVAVGDIIIVRGTVMFAKLDKPVDGKALDKVNQRRVEKGMKETKPFRRITIKNPSFIQGEDTPLAKFYEQNMYQNNMTLESKSPFPPTYKHLQNGVSVMIEDPQKNPAIGQEIMIQISAFQSKGFPYLGSGLDVIIFPEGPFELYEASRAEDKLSGFGKSFDLPATADILDLGKMALEIRNSPFNGINNSNINGKYVSLQTKDMMQTDATDVPVVTKTTKTSPKMLNGKESNEKTETINIDSPFGPNRNSEFTEKTGISSTSTLSRFT
ncbi:hypothetical protein [Paenibacillus sp. FSL R7-0026]|uniref:hypothetical protein n=1 Tax=Paenibacillus sp. FSL R7-0026 TaxID=2921668 RepID=UPI0030FCCC99